ncbi:hypothetical protein SFRURICE_013126 [Spodoptera frugiperda]|nr:hypothetical protein SFRURICE_013126 [Spodoptera frugiperda]
MFLLTLPTSPSVTGVKTPVYVSMFVYTASKGSFPPDQSQNRASHFTLASKPQRPPHIGPSMSDDRAGAADFTVTRAPARRAEVGTMGWFLVSKSLTAPHLTQGSGSLLLLNE